MTSSAAIKLYQLFHPCWARQHKNFVKLLNFFPDEEINTSSKKDKWCTKRQTLLSIDKGIYDWLAGLSYTLQLEWDDNTEDQVDKKLVKSLKPLYADVAEFIVKFIERFLNDVGKHVLTNKKECQQRLKSFQDELVTLDKIVAGKTLNPRAKIVICRIIGFVVGFTFGFTVAAAATFWSGSFAALPAAIVAGVKGCTLAQGVILSSSALISSGLFFSAGSAYASIKNKGLSTTAKEHYTNNLRPKLVKYS